MPDIAQTIKNDLSWLQRHERLLICTMVILAVTFLGNKWLDNRSTGAAVQAALAQQKAVVLQQKVDEDVKQSAVQAAQNAQIAAQYQSMVDTLNRQVASLAAAVAQRNNNLVNQQASNQTAPLPNVAKRWVSLADLQPTDLTVADTGINVNDTAVRKTVNLLEEVPVLQKNVQDIQQIADNRQIELSKANDLIAGQNTQIGGLIKQVTDEKASHKADVDADRKEIDSVKADARKSKRNWFIAGFITGVATRLLGHF
jgi:hypothetical protein